jgi:hypothetical protein
MRTKVEQISGMSTTPIENAAESAEFLVVLRQ